MPSNAIIDEFIQIYRQSPLRRDVGMVMYCVGISGPVSPIFSPFNKIDAFTCFLLSVQL